MLSKRSDKLDDNNFKRSQKDFCLMLVYGRDYCIPKYSSVPPLMARHLNVIKSFSRQYLTIVYFTMLLSSRSEMYRHINQSMKKTQTYICKPYQFQEKRHAIVGSANDERRYAKHKFSKNLLTIIILTC